MRKMFLSFTLAMFITFLFTGCSKETLVNENANDTDTSMEMGYTKFTGTRTKTITLTAGTVVTVDIVTNDGRIDLSVTNKSGNQPYAGNRITTNQFTFNIIEDDEYTIKIIGISHNGSYKISWE